MSCLLRFGPLLPPACEEEDSSFLMSMPTSPPSSSVLLSSEPPPKSRTMNPPERGDAQRSVLLIWYKKTLNESLNVCVWTRNVTFYKKGWPKNSFFSSADAKLNYIALINRIKGGVSVWCLHVFRCPHRCVGLAQRALNPAEVGLSASLRTDRP